MNVEADRILLNYFSDNINTVESWFNVISPNSKSLTLLKEELEVLRGKDWKMILV